MTRQNIRYSGVNCALGSSKSIRYSGDFIIAGFIVFYCNSAGLSNVVQCNGAFIIAGFAIAGCHCIYMHSPRLVQWLVQQKMYAWTLRRVMNGECETLWEGKTRVFFLSRYVLDSY